MKTFDIKRFCNVARWDLTVNSRFYLRMLLIIACCVLTPVLVLYLNILINDGSSFYAANQAVRIGNLESMSKMLYAYAIVMQIVMLGYTFHNLRTKQGRIDELTLPATNAERFTWHVLFSIVAPIAAFWLCELVADGVQMLFARLLLGVQSPESLTCTLWRRETFKGISIVFENATSVHEVCAIIWIILLLASFYSTFALGNAWKYHSNIGLTLGAHIVLAISMMVLVGIISSIEPLAKFIEKTLSADLPDWVAIGFLLTSASVLLIAIWWLTYRLYCKAQITTRRNP